MPHNLGATTLKSHRRARNPMQDYDRLPAELRRWVAQANLPWSPQSVQKAYKRAMAKTGDRDLALVELDKIQSALVQRDSQRLLESAR